MQCALTLKPTRFCFTLKPRDGGKGKVTIGPSAFETIKRVAPALYVKLERGRHFLHMMADAEASDLKKHAMLRRRTTVQRKLVDLRYEAKKRIRNWRMAHRGEQIPEALAALQLLIGKKQPELTGPEAETQWAEQGILELEEALLTAPVVEDAPMPTELPAPLVEGSQAASLPALKPIPMLEF